MAPKFKAPTEKTVRALLARYACPVPYHEVRTRFLGGIASPVSGISPLPIVKALWGGEFPPFDTIEDLNHLIDVLINQLWNSLRNHRLKFLLAMLNGSPFTARKVVLSEGLHRVAIRRRMG